MEKILREINLCEGIDLGWLTINILANANNIALLRMNKQIVIQMGNSLIKAVDKIVLKINEEKTECMMVSRKNENQVQKEVIEVEKEGLK